MEGMLDRVCWTGCAGQATQNKIHMSMSGGWASFLESHEPWNPENLKMDAVGLGDKGVEVGPEWTLTLHSSGMSHHETPWFPPVTPSGMNLYLVIKSTRSPKPCGDKDWLRMKLLRSLCGTRCPHTRGALSLPLIERDRSVRMGYISIPTLHDERHLYDLQP